MGPIGISFYPAGDFLTIQTMFFRWSQIRKMSKRRNEKTMVGFGRTEKWLSLSCIEFRALSHGHGFRGPCFNGVRKSWVFHDFFDRLFWATSRKNWERWKNNGKVKQKQWKTNGKRRKREGGTPGAPPPFFSLVFHWFSIVFV